MRYLNKITFINSASAKYAEINLDGNVHFIGTQGVGKSTILRAILFFYNADTLKLGIPREKRGFAEYYFPYANSFIVYEVARETGAYCILVFKSQGRVCFRFIDTAYTKEYFISADGKAFESQDKIKAALDLAQVNHTRKIDNYGEYRDIIYGNNEGKKEFRKYALLESRQYLNIPRTIQNVFLNSRLEAEFIKDTIIMSMNEDENGGKVDLTNYAHHLKDFEAQLKDIQQFRQPGVLKQAENTSKLHLAIKHLEREKILIAKQLAWALENVQETKPKMLEKLEKEENSKGKWLQKIREASGKYQAKREKELAEISVLNNQLKNAKEKEGYYQKLNINQLIERVNQKANLEREHEDKTKEKELLSEQYKDVSQKYDSLVKELENQLVTFENNKKSSINIIESGFLNVKERITDTYTSLVEDIRAEHNEKLKEARQDLENKKENSQKLKIKKAEIKHKRFYEEEIRQGERETGELKAYIQSIKNDIEHLKGETETLQKQWELEEEKIKQALEVQKEKLNDKITALLSAITAIDFKIQNSKESFYGWLNVKNPGWEQTIGKVVNEDVLFQSGLYPSLSLEKSNTFFGVNIDLKEIEKTVKTVADYEKEKTKAEEGIDEIRRQIANLDTAYNADMDRLKKKYHPKIKECKDKVKENDYNLEQSIIKKGAVEVSLNDYLNKAKTEKQTSLENIENELAEAAEEELKAEEISTKVAEEIEKRVKAKNKERDKKIEEELSQKSQQLATIELEIQNQKKASANHIAEINSQKEKELAGKGADTNAIRIIEDRLVLINTELKFIDSQSVIVVEYFKDKRELFDHVDKFKNQKQIHEQRLASEEQKYRSQDDMIKKGLSEVEETIGLLTEELKNIKEDLDEFEKFRQMDIYPEMAEYFIAHTENKTNKRCRDLVDELKAKHYELKDRFEELKKDIKKFLGNFSEQNIFNFKVNPIENIEYLYFAEEISSFVEDSKIEEYEKRVNERYAEIIKLIGRETTDLTSREGEIQKVITQINRDFKEKNFVGVIKNIELKLDDSANRVVVMLKEVKKFNDENTDDLGVANLFSSQNNDVKNKRAVDLLKQLIKEINDFKKDYITLSDSFELKFKIEENQNDTGWVEKLSNVGSEGTDILVKAMINIMLLNVFKEGASKKGFKDFKLHCVMDEIGRLHPGNVRGILKFANDRNILLINGSPTENDALAYRHIYKLEKDEQSITKVKRIISQTKYAEV